jgi:hypothetical protein
MLLLKKKSTLQAKLNKIQKQTNKRQEEAQSQTTITVNARRRVKQTRSLKL